MDEWLIVLLFGAGWAAFELRTARREIDRLRRRLEALEHYCRQRDHAQESTE